jgi:tetratricopeptide (TPR) repeat protein
LVGAAGLALLASIAVAEPADQLAAGRVDDAISALQSRIRTYPNDAAAYNLLCRAYFMVGDWDSAITACEKAVSLDPNNSRYHLWLGRSYGEKAEQARVWRAASLSIKVRTEFETAVRLDPNDADARTDLAEFYLEAPGVMGGGMDKAAIQAQQLMPLDASRAYWVRARIAEKNKDMATAETEYNKAIQASNGRGDAWFNLALFYRKVKRFDQMQDAIEKIRTSAVSQPNVLMEAAEVLIRAGRNSDSATDLLRRYLASPTVEQGPAFKAHYLMGTVLEKKGDRQGAQQEYRTALSMSKNYSPARTALERLDSQASRRS